MTRCPLPTGLLLVCGLLVMAAVAGRADEVFLEATRTESQRITVGLMAWAGTPETEEAAREGVGLLLADLDRSAVFTARLASVGTIQDPAQLPEAVLQAAGQQALDVLVWGALVLRQRDLVLEARAFDGKTGRHVAGKRYIGTPRTLRLMVHRFADELVFRYTGEPGVAQTRIVYVAEGRVRADASPEAVKELHVMDADGANDGPLTADRTLNLWPRWSPDGRWIAYTTYRDGTPKIMLLDMQTARRQVLVDFPGLNLSPAWAAGGAMLAFATSKDGSTEIYTVDRAGRRFRRLTEHPAENFSPTWSSSGRELAFVSDRVGSPQVYLMDAEGGHQRRLTFEGLYNTAPAWSPKGDWIAYVCRFGRLRLCLIRPDGSGWRRLTEGAWDDESPTWSPDGRHLAFSSTRTGRHEIYRMSLNGMQVEQLTHGGGDKTSPSWSPRY